MSEHPDSLWQPFPEELTHRGPLGLGRARATVGNGVGRAIEILEERFARGEIDARELKEGRTALQG